MVKVSSVTCVVFLIGILCFGAIGPVGAAVPASPDNQSTPQLSDEPGAERIGSMLQNAGGTVEVIVRFDDSERVSVAGSSDPIGTLQTRANRTQDDFLSYISVTDGLKTLDRFWIANAVLIEVDTTKVPLEAVTARDGVQRVHENYEITTTAASSVAQTPTTRPAQTAVFPTTQHTYGLTQINAPAAWNQYETQGEGTTVAVLDSGVDVTNHSDLTIGSNGWADFVNGRSTPYDDNGHGTHVSGTIAGHQTTAGVQYGVAPNTTLLHGKVVNASGSGSLSDLLNGMQWATTHPSDPDVLSMSLGVPTRSGDIFIEPVVNAKQAGTVVVASSGNNGVRTSSSPGNIYDAVGVGASAADESIARFSSGETIVTSTVWPATPTTATWPTDYLVPAVAAPGVDVKSALAGGGYGNKSGTSMAAPHVAGTAALMQSATAETLQPGEIETALQSTARFPSGGPTAPNDRYGSGIIDATAAVDAVTVPPEFRLRGLSAPSVLSQNESYNVTVDVTNVGDTTGTQTITYELVTKNGSTALQSSAGRTLGSGVSRTTRFEVPAASTNSLSGNYTHVISTANESTTASMTVANATSGPGDVTNDGRAALDLDGDGLYEDVNGDGKHDLRDLRPYFGYVTDASNRYAAGFDFTGDQSLDLRDLRPFFDRL